MADDIPDPFHSDDEGNPTPLAMTDEDFLPLIGMLVASKDAGLKSGLPICEAFEVGLQTYLVALRASMGFTP